MQASRPNLPLPRARRCVSASSPFRAARSTIRLASRRSNHFPPPRLVWQSRWSSVRARLKMLRAGTRRCSLRAQHRSCAFVRWWPRSTRCCARPVRSTNLARSLTRLPSSFARSTSPAVARRPTRCATRFRLGFSIRTFRRPASGCLPVCSTPTSVWRGTAPTSCLRPTPMKLRAPRLPSGSTRRFLA